MTRGASLLLHGAVIAIGIAMIVTAADRPTHAPPRAARPAPAGVTPSSSPRSRAPIVVEDAITVARAYALTARNWTAATYERSWRRQLTLAAGAYRRQLRAARPTRAQLVALKSDMAASSATVTRVQPDARVRAPRARVVVWLAERTHAAGQTITGMTRNEVRLHRAREGRWRVTGWTALPGAGAGP
jgi:hypothetical protein